MRHLTLKETKKIVQKLSGHFSIPMPTIKFNDGHKSWATYNKHLICMGCDHDNYVWLNPIDSVLHEFAHMLNYYRGNIREGVWRVHHGIHFQLALCDTVMVYYGNLYKYGWDLEYASICKAFGNGELLEEYKIFCKERKVKLCQ